MSVQRAANALQTLIVDRNLDEIVIMNLLQNNGIISDLCIWAKDVSPADAERAVAWLQKEPQPQR